MYHANINTDNFVESFNNVLKNHYLTLRHDKSIFSLAKILLLCIFPDQEREYAVLTAKQSSLHRVPRNDIPEFLTNRPFEVQASCIANMERSKKVPAQPYGQKTEYSESNLQVGAQCMMSTSLMVIVHVLK